MLINHLEPRGVWGYFEEICKIPRLSKNEGRIREYLKDFANKNDLRVKEDSVGNILITRESDPGFENRKPVLLQSHLDMVGEKDAGTIHNWSKDPIIPLIEGDWVTAKITTLGADDGIGIAAQMAILADKSLKLGKIECLFTVDEETGMTGAINLQPGFFESDILLNLDSEDEGELFIGCAGGVDTVALFDNLRESYSGSGKAFTISVTGLHGGHSGDEIHNGYANSVKLINEVLSFLALNHEVRISSIEAGNLRNAIPREAFVTAYIDGGANLPDSVSQIESQLRNEYVATEPNITINIEPTEGDGLVMTKSVQDNLLNALSKCPHGVISWSETMEGLVETSTNLASVKIEGDIIKIVTSQRSSVERAKTELKERLSGIFAEAGARVIHSDGYPGWEPNPNSEILKITSESYTRLFLNKPVVRAIHAGLECGLILVKYPGLDMISFGPTIKGAHTPEEKINIETTRKFWDLLIDVIQNIPERQT